MKNKFFSKKEARFYNVIFPVWMLFIFPQVWLVVLPGNFVIDSIVLIISMFALKQTDKKEFYKKHILKIFLFGMLSDIIAAVYMLIMIGYFEIGVMGDELYLTLPALLIAVVLIFVLNYIFSFRKDEKALRLKFSLIFAIATAPYTFLIPVSWIY